MPLGSFCADFSNKWEEGGKFINFKKMVFTFMQNVRNGDKQARP